MGEAYQVPAELQRRIEAGEAEEWETPFECEVCGDFKPGGEMSNISDNTCLICIACHHACEDIQDVTGELVRELIRKHSNH